MKNEIVASVVVATFNRSKLLETLIEALLNQETLFNYEIIIVDDGSTDSTRHILHQHSEHIKDFRYITQKNCGPAAARNAGIKAAKGKFIAFTDDDCIPARDWLQKGVEAFKHDTIIGVQGRTWTKMKSANMLTHQIDNETGNTSVPTCNAFYRSSIFDKIQFDSRFPYPHNEDADLAWNAMQYGSIVFDMNVNVYHPIRHEPLKKLLNRPKYLASEFLLYEKHSELYKKFRAQSAWHNIFINWFFVAQYYNLRMVLRSIKNPKLFIKSSYLLFCWWFKAISFIPFYKKHSKMAKNA